MIEKAIVVWLAERGGPEGDDAKRALDAWAKARGVELAAPGENGAQGPAAVPWDAGESVERGLARVRDALAGLEFDAAERELARAEALLRAHPELPQAAWLRAEVERAWSVRWLRGGDDDRAKRAWQRAAGLDGGREAALGEKAFASDAPVTATIRLLGGGEGEEGGEALRLDGVLVPAGEVKRSAGEHALAIVRGDGSVMWAEWVSLAEGTEVRIEAPEPPACSQGDMKRARLVNGAVEAAGVRCGAWVAAVPSGGSVVRVATCEAATCGPFVEWRSIAETPSGWTFGPTSEPSSGTRWPAWATWTLAGVGVAGAAVGIAAAAGAFRSSGAVETQFVNNGIAIHSF